MKGLFSKTKGGGSLDEEILELFMKRDENAIAETERKYGAYCLAIAKNICKNQQDAEECLSTALLALWNSVPPEKPDNIKIYLAKITRNAAINMLNAEKTQKRGGNISCEAFDELDECIPSSQRVEDSIIAEELSNSINRFLKELPERERNIFIRRYFHGEDIKDMAAGYKISKGHITVILHRTRKKLKKHLCREGYFQ